MLSCDVISAANMIESHSLGRCISGNIEELAANPDNLYTSLECTVPALI